MPTDEEMRYSPPKRPVLLGLLIDAQNEQYSAIDEKYITFLKLAWQAQKDMETSCLVVTANVVTKPFDAEEESELKGSWTAVKKSNYLSSSFSNMFDLYKTFIGGDIAVTFDAIDHAEESLSTENVLSFLRDLQVMPKLLSRDEFSRVWAEMSQDMVARKEKPLVRQSLEHFKEFVVRVALFVFNAVGMRKAILACSGLVPTPELMVQYFLHYMRLDDEVFITEFISNTRADRLGLEETNGHADQEPTALKPLKTLVADEFNKFQQLDPVPTRKMLLKDAEAKKKAEQAKAGIAEQVATPSKRRDARTARSPLSKFSGASLLPPEIRALLDDPTTNTYIMSIKPIPAEEKKKILTETEEKALTHKLEAEAILKAKIDKANLPPPRNNYKELYHKELLSAVSACCKPKPDKAVVEGNCASRGSFVDFGRVNPGSLCTVRLFLHNRSPNDMNVDVSTRGFDDENSKVTTNPKPLVAGLSRMICYQFQAPFTTRSLIGSLELTVTNQLERYGDTLKIPVFLYVSPRPLMSSDREMPTLCVDTLPQTLEKYEPTFFNDMHVAIADFDGMSQIGSAQKGSAHSLKSSARTLSSSSSQASLQSAKLYRGTSFATPRNNWYGQERVGGGGVKLAHFTASRTTTKAALREKSQFEANTERSKTGSAFPMHRKSRQRDASTNKLFLYDGTEDNDTLALSTLGDPLLGGDSQWDNMEA